ncbi:MULTISPECIES: hypothetical protein [Niastella]|uniref:DinB family protein n=1 Tax=Niastella soli TaxID=2821487 RepID=A0ABS3YV49_9BACT|nr:hypothetical protein [Niastella soli]MBO9201628.1 hypothetical protein [Niastella soli]
MQLQQAVNTIFVQLADSLSQLSQPQYSQSCSTLFNNTIGQHVRHIIELFQCLENGYESGTVNYEKRKRDTLLETDKGLAGTLLLEIHRGLNKPNKTLTLEASYDEHVTESIAIDTNYFREIAYNLEHTIHHMALIRVGITEITNIHLPDNFGVASSTIKYRNQCAQ